MPRNESPFHSSLTSSRTTTSAGSLSSVPTSASGPPVVLLYSQGWLRKAALQTLRRLDVLFTAAIPVEHVKDMPTRFKYGLGSLALLGLLGLFAALFSTAFVKQLNQEFLSSLSSSDASPNCETILVANTGQYMATKGGVWEGYPGFKYSEATYEITLSNFAASYAAYAYIMGRLYSSLYDIGLQMEQQDLGLNIIYWTSYSRLPDSSNQAQRFFAIGDAVVVFNRQKVLGSLSSSVGVCNITSYSDFMASEAQISTQFSYEEFASNGVCNFTNPINFDYVPGANSQFFEMGLDVRSLMTAMAVNLGILDFNDIVEIASFRTDVGYDGQLYSVSSYYDPKYPGMDPIICLATAEYQFCTIPIGTSFAFPFFHHLGNNTELPKKCICSELSNVDLYKYSPCNLFRFLGGLIFWQTPSADPLFELMFRYNFSYSAINNEAYHAAFLSSFWGQQSTKKEYLNSEEYLNSSFQFCDTNLFGACSMYTISAFDVSYAEWSVSNYYYQLTGGACNASLTPPLNDWNELITNPYSPLIQHYQKCFYSATTAGFTQFGVSIGNLSAATPFFIICFMAALALAQTCFGFSIPVLAYSKEEKDAAIEILAVALLRERDRQLSNSTAGGITCDLVRELTKETAACALGGGEKLVITHLESTTASPMVRADVELVSMKSSYLILNKSSSSSLTSEGIKDFPQWWASSGQPERVELLRKFQSSFQLHYIKRFVNISSAATDDSTSFWSLASDTGVFVFISWKADIVGSELMEIMGEILLMHSCLQMNVTKHACLKRYAEKVGYRFSDCESCLQSFHLTNIDASLEGVVV